MTDARQQELEILEGIRQRLAMLPPDQQKAALLELDPQLVRDLMNYLIAGLDADQQQQVGEIAAKLHQNFRPRTDDELHRYILDECGLDIPRRGVCPGHCAPFDFVADVYFERGKPDKLAIGNRGSGKTQNVGSLHAVNGRTKPRFEAATAGAIEPQAKKCYNYMKETCERVSWKGVVKPSKLQMAKTTFENGSVVEIITGTLGGVNSPHPHLAHLDEIELFRPGVFEEAMHMAQSSKGYRAQNVYTTSWKKPKGQVTEIIDEVEQAVREGNQPAYDIYRWCIFETAKQCPHDCSACPFSNVVKGSVGEGDNKQPRTFEMICKTGSPEPGVGKLKFADGFVDVEDVVARFQKLSRRHWEAQQESKKPTAEGLAYDNFDEDRHTVDNWDPDPDNGQIDIGIDFGGTNPHAIGFWQELAVEVALPDGRRLKEGSHVCFDEIYVADIGNTELGKRLNQRIWEWDQLYPGFRDSITGFYCDSAAKAARLDLLRLPAHGDQGDPLYRSIKTFARNKPKVDESVGEVYEVIDKNLLYVDRQRCPKHIHEFGSYELTKKEHDHAMDAMRYRFWYRSRRNAAPRTRSDEPKFSDRHRPMVGPGERRPLIAALKSAAPGLPRVSGSGRTEMRRRSRGEQ